MAELYCRLEAPNEIAKEFVERVKQHDVPAIISLLKNNDWLRENVDQHWFAFDSPAVVFAKDHSETVKALVEQGADINNRSSWWAGGFGVLDDVDPDLGGFYETLGANWTIHAAVGAGRIEWVHRLLAENPNLVNARGGDGQTPLHFAKSIEMVDLLVDKGADLEIRDLDHSATPAQYAVDSPDVCRHMIHRGAQPDIFMAAALGENDWVDQIVNENPEAVAQKVGFSPETRPVDPRSSRHIYFWKLVSAQTPLEVADRFGHTRIFEALFKISSPRQQWLTALWKADSELLEPLLPQKSELQSLLTLEDHRSLARAAWEGRLETVKTMLEMGFDPHVRGDEESTPLDRAAFHGYHEIIECLLNRDPKPPLTWKNAHGGTPLGCCIYGSLHSWIKEGDHLASAELLIQAGAPFDKSWLPTGNKDMDELLTRKLSQ